MTATELTPEATQAAHDFAKHFGVKLLHMNLFEQINYLAWGAYTGGDITKSEYDRIFGVVNRIVERRTKQSI